MQEAVTSVEGSRLIIDFGGTGLSPEAVQERVGEVAPLLKALLTADASLQKLTPEQYAQRGRGFMAIDMMCQAAIQSATQQAKVLHGIVAGSASIADYGFPEFDGDKSVEV